MKNLRQYLPVFGMVLAVVLNALYVATQDGRLSLTEALTLVVALAGAIVTYVVPRFPNAQWLKTICAGVTAAVIFLVSALVDGSVSAQEWVMFLIQLLAGLGIVAATNKQVPFTEPSSTRPAA